MLPVLGATVEEFGGDSMVELATGVEQRTMSPEQEKMSQGRRDERGWQQGPNSRRQEMCHWPCVKSPGDLTKYPPSAFVGFVVSSLDVDPLSSHKRLPEYAKNERVLFQNDFQSFELYQF